MESLVVERVGRLVPGPGPGRPWLVVDDAGEPVAAVSLFLDELQACGCSAATLRSYGMDLLRWWRFLSAVGVCWDRAGREEGRDFARWLRLAAKPGRVGQPVGRGEVNPVTGRAGPGAGYAAATAAHSETVLRTFYDFHLGCGRGPLVNPFPLAPARRGGRAHAHHNPLEPFTGQRVGAYRPKLPARVPRSIPDAWFDEVFAALACHRDRAMVAFYVSTGARAAELLGARQGDVDPGGGLVTVRRKGSGVSQPLPASPDAFTWLRLYQQEWDARVPVGTDESLWWTVRGAVRPLTYHAARAAFRRAQAALGSNWTLHDLRHTAAYRMAQDPQVRLTDVQWVLGHARLSTTQIYLTPRVDEVTEAMRAHNRRRAADRDRPPAPPAPGYRPETLAVLFAQPAAGGAPEGKR